jgi:hypothetical protein
MLAMSKDERTHLASGELDGMSLQSMSLSGMAAKRASMACSSALSDEAASHRRTKPSIKRS